MATLTVQPEYRALVESNGLANFDALFAAGEHQRIDGHNLRSVSRLELRAGDRQTVVVYLKRWWGARAGLAWADLLCLRRPMTAACREWSNSMRLLRAIDLQRLTRHRRGIGERWVVKDLAALLFSSWPSPATGIRSNVFTDTDRMRFARAHFGVERLTAEHKRLLCRVAAKARAIARHEDRRREREESRV
jgi:hypothetical protein